MHSVLICNNVCNLHLAALLTSSLPQPNTDTQHRYNIMWRMPLFTHARQAAPPSVSTPPAQIAGAQRPESAAHCASRTLPVTFTRAGPPSLAVAIHTGTGLGGRHRSRRVRGGQSACSSAAEYAGRGSAGTHWKLPGTPGAPGVTTSGCAPRPARLGKMLVASSRSPLASPSKKPYGCSQKASLRGQGREPPVSAAAAAPGGCWPHASVRQRISGTRRVPRASAAARKRACICAGAAGARAGGRAWRARAPTRRTAGPRRPA